MEPEWLRIATSPGMWLIGFVFALSGLIQSFLFYRHARTVGARLKIRSEAMDEAIKASFITSIGPALGSFVGMSLLVITLGGAYAFARESAGVGSIMYELIALRVGAETAGVPMTREGMTVQALPVMFWVAALGSVGWVLLTGLFTRWLPKMKEWFGGGDPLRLQVVVIVITLGAFSRMVTSDSIRPLLLKGQWPNMSASLTGMAVALGWILWCDRINKPTLKEYFVLAAVIAGMIVGQVVRLATT
ncbi:MAG: DUF5058 family protein [Armatimonadetes bacterium]|nr:DUF5058 family protein [Armatimonadota bacterium]